MLSIFTFHFGDSYNESSDWMQWVSIILGFLGAYFIYWNERKQSAQDAYDLFQNSLLNLQDAVGKAVNKLNEFSDGLSGQGDNFESPSLPTSLNDSLLSVVEVDSLFRHYRKKQLKKLNVVKDFLKRSSFISSYHGIFLNELNYWRGAYASKEDKFKQHQLLWVTKYFEVLLQRHEPRDEHYSQEYKTLRDSVAENGDIIDKKKGEIINRGLLNDKFVKPLAELSLKYLPTDMKANEVIQLALEINSARVDMDAQKKALKDMVDGNIKEFNEIKGIIDGLID